MSHFSPLAHEFFAFMPSLDDGWSVSEACRFLRERKVDPNVMFESGWRPLHYAARFRSPGLIEALLEQGADPELVSAEGLLPLHVAIYDSSQPNSHQLDVVKALLKAAPETIDVPIGSVRDNVEGITPQRIALDKMKKTPLQLVSENRSINPELVSELLNSGADVGRLTLEQRAQLSDGPPELQQWTAKLRTERGIDSGQLL